MLQRELPLCEVIVTKEVQERLSYDLFKEIKHFRRSCFLITFAAMAQKVFAILSK